ncbi:MAG: molybdate ABC transporter substrate-binding protein [Nitrospiraceae bacterium]
MPSTSTQLPAAEINVLSAGAIKTGLANLAQAFEENAGHKVVITFATAPVLRSKVENEEAQADIVIAPAPMMKDFEKNGRVLPGSSTVLGKVKAAVVVRDGAPKPDISTAEAFRKEILAARSLVYNQASSGLYIEKLMERLGVLEDVKANTTRVPTGAAVMKHLASSRTEREIGFGQVPEILVYRNQGVELVGPLPKEIENVTTYAAGVLADASVPEPAHRFIQFLTTPSAKAAFIAAGVE